MVMQSTRNLTEYHSVFADSIYSTINKLGTGDESAAKKIMTFILRQAYVLYRMDTQAQRIEVDARLNEMRMDYNKMSQSKRSKYPPGYDAVLKEELDAMQLDKCTIEELEIKLFAFMTLAGIKPVQNNQQRAGGFERFSAELK